MEKKKKLSVFAIIVTYNGMRWYKRCFDSLKMSSIPVTIVVVDNASTDGSVDFIRSEYPEVIVLESNINLGFGKANNLALKYVLNNQVDYVFLLNQDAWIEPNVISSLIEIHYQNPTYGILSPIHLNKSKDSIEKDVIDYITDLNNISKCFINDMFFGNLQQVYEVKFMNAASWLLPIETIKTVGGFNPVFFHYGEDDNYIHRVCFHGLKVGFCPKLRIVHDTETRNKSIKSAERSIYKSLLTEWCNINNDFNDTKLAFFYIRKILIFFIKFDKKQIKHYKGLYQFLQKNKQEVKFSRKQNIKKGVTWL